MRGAAPRRLALLVIDLVAILAAVLLAMDFLVL
jgi:hypothetical protein